MGKQKSLTVNSDRDYQLIDNIHKEIGDLKDGEEVIQIITSPCFTQALIIFKECK